MSWRERQQHRWQEVLDGDLSAEAMAHVVDCRHCAARIRAVDEAATVVRAALPDPTADLDGRVLRALAGSAREAAGRVQRRRRVLRHAAMTAAAAAVASMVLAVVLWPVGRAEPAFAVPVGPLSAVCGDEGTATGDSGRLLVAGVWAGEEARRFATVLRDFERRTGVGVAYAYETRDIAAKLEARLRRGCPPDVALLPQPGLLRDFARRGLIQRLDRATAGAVRRNYGPSWRRLGSFGGRLYGVWFKAANKSMVWYRPEALRAAGISRPPADWDAFVEVARRLRATGVQPLSVAGADGWTLTDWFENVYLRMAGPRRYDELARHEISWSHPTVRRALAALAALLRDETAAGPPAETLQTSFEQSVHAVFGKHPRAAMVFEGDFVRAFAPSPTAIDFFGFPALRPGSGDAVVAGGDVAAMFNAGTGAQRLMHHLATPRAAHLWSREGGFLSPNRRLPSTAYPDALTRRAASALANARTVRFDLSDLQPPAFGAVEGQGMWAILRDLLREPDATPVTARRLEAAARAAFACEANVRGTC